MKTLRLAVLATLIGVGVLGVVSGHAQVAPPGDKIVVPRWEYESVSGENEKSYKEMVAFSSIPELVGKEQTFTAKFEDDKWELTGTLSSGVEINEVWRKVK